MINPRSEGDHGRWERQARIVRLLLDAVKATGLSAY